MGQGPLVPHSDEVFATHRYRSVKLAQQRRLFKRARTGTPTRPEEVGRDNIELATAAVLCWHGWEDGDEDRGWGGRRGDSKMSPV